MFFVVGNLLLPFWAEFVVASLFASTNIAGLISTYVDNKTERAAIDTIDARRRWGLIILSLLVLGELLPCGTVLSWHTKAIAIFHCCVAVNQRRRITQRTFQFLAGFSWIGVVDLLMKEQSPSCQSSLSVAWIIAMCMLVSPFLSITGTVYSRVASLPSLFTAVMANRRQSQLQTSGATDLCSVALVLLLFLHISPDFVVSFGDVGAYFARHIMRDSAVELDDGRARVVQILVLCIANQLGWVAIKKLLITSSSDASCGPGSEIPRMDSSVNCDSSVFVFSNADPINNDSIVGGTAASGREIDPFGTANVIATTVPVKEKPQAHQASRLGFGGIAGRLRNISSRAGLPTVVDTVVDTAAGATVLGAQARTKENKAATRSDSDLIATSIQNLATQQEAYLHQHHRRCVSVLPGNELCSSPGADNIAVQPCTVSGAVTVSASAVSATSVCETSVPILLGEDFSEEEALSIIQQGLLQVKAKRAI